MGSLKTAMHLGEKWQLVPKQNWAVIPKLKVPRGRVVFHTPEEIDKILAACPNEKKDYLTGNYPLIAKSVGISSFLHKLRHTFASQLGQNGVELYTVSKLLGHRNIQTTEIYAHLTPETMQKAVTHLPKHNSPALHIEAKTVCAPDKACLQLSTDLSDYVKKLYILFSLYKQQIIGKKLKLFIK